MDLTKLLFLLYSFNSSSLLLLFIVLSLFIFLLLYGIGMDDILFLYNDNDGDLFILSSLLFDDDTIIVSEDWVWPKIKYKIIKY